MSSPDSVRRSSLRLGGAALAVLLLSGCLRPLYGPTASGASLRDALASVEVAPVAAALNQERLGHHLRSELVFDLDGSGQPRPKQYKLAIAVSERVATQIVNSATGRADSATLVADAEYKLTTLDGSRTIATGTATGSAVYDRNVQRFASLRAARDAEIRVAKLLAEQIRTRLTAALPAS